MPAQLSVIVICLNEGAAITRTLAPMDAWRARGVEVIVVDGTSEDDTVEQAYQHANRVLVVSAGRARQLNAGAAVAKGQNLLFLHADTIAPNDADQIICSSIRQADNPMTWGRFNVRIEGQSQWLAVIAFMMNWRSRITGIATGDQGLFMTRAAYDAVGGFADQPIMEDIETSQRLCQLSWPICLPQKVTTSGRRWETRGVWRTIMLMWSLRWRYWRGESAASLAKDYR
jgi:rSAM/selenodomain-associated transferase 2|uniref:TIGR04283 family arsenosugar biosynthesis glycosyltransferase n=1 Tax=Orrella sp. TaxID=1921583 RepID=UPI0040480FEF